MIKTIFAVSILTMVHSWYPLECCSDKDCQPVPCDELKKDGKGIRHVPTHDLFRGSDIRASMDAQCHVCVGISGNVRVPRCVFMSGVS